MARLLVVLLLASIPLSAQDRFDAILDVVEKNFSQAIPRGTLEERAFKAFLKDLDPYSSYMNAEEWVDDKRELHGTFGGVGIFLETDPETKLPRIRNLLIDSPAGAAGARRGDLLAKIDGRSLEGLELDKVFPMLRGEPGSTIALTLRRPGASKSPTLRFKRKEIQMPSVRGVRRNAASEPQYLLDPAKGIGYIRVMKLTDDTVPALENALRMLKRQGMRGLIFDLRDSAGGKLDAAVAAADLFLDGGRIITVASRVDGDEHYDADPAVMTDVPMVMLINEWTASSSEILAGALTDNHRAITVGQRTYGKGRVQVTFSLPEGMGGVVLSTGTFQRPSGKTIDQHDAAAKKGEAGIAPDPGMELILGEEESRSWADEARRLDGPLVLTEEEQKFGVPDRVLECALDALAKEMRR
jgi:carboxyl-terminal processing protease